MRRPLTVGAVLVALGLAVWSSMSSGPEASGQSQGPPPRRGLSSPQRASAVMPPGAVPASTPSHEALHIQGTVYGPHGPLPGVTVVATAPQPGETLSTLRCEEDARRSLLDCQNGLIGEDVKWVPLLEQRQGEAPEHARAVSAADGTFTLEGLAPGTYTLWAEGAAGAALPLDVEAGSEAVTLRLGQGWFIAGRVRHEAGLSLAGMRITAVYLAHTRFFETLAGEEGRFRLGPLPPGPSLVLFSHAGSLPELRRIDRNAEGLNEFLLSERRLSGQVVHEGVPVAGARVQLRIISSIELHAPLAEKGPREALTDAKGRFAFSGLRSSLYELTAVHHHQGAATVVQPDKEPQDVVLELGTAHLLEGSVRDDRGQPIEGASVAFTARLEATHSVESRHAVTDARGHYWLGPLPGGEGRLSVSAERYVDAAREVVLGRRGSPQDVTLTSAASVEGVVVDARGEPVPGLPVGLTWAGAPGEPPPFNSAMQVLSEEGGRFILDAPRPGPYELQVGGGTAPSEPLRVMAPTRGLRVVVTRGGTVSGSVLDAAGAPAWRAQLQVSRLLEDELSLELETMTSVDSRGRFWLKHLTPGRYLLQVLEDPYNSLRHLMYQVDVKPGEEVRVDLHLPQGRTLSGQVVDTEGRPLQGVEVTALVGKVQVPGMDQGLYLVGLRGRASTDAQGRFSLQGLTHEEVRLEATRSGYTYEPGLGTGGPVEGGKQRIRVDAPEVRLVLRKLSEKERLEEEERLFEPTLEPDLYTVP